MRNSASKKEPKDDMDEDDDAEITQKEAATYESFCPDVFGRVIHDEAQRLKNCTILF